MWSGKGQTESEATTSDCISAVWAWGDDNLNHVSNSGNETEDRSEAFGSKLDENWVLWCMKEKQISSMAWSDDVIYKNI